MPPVRADRDRLVQVLINLLSNAVKFVRRRARARRRRAAATARDALRVDVTRQRPGHRRATTSSVIFEKFRQAGDTLTEKPQGTGLGLPISRQIIEHLGGRLWVESEPGRGATFAFALPLSAAAAAAQRTRTDRRERSAHDVQEERWARRS